MGEAMKTLLSLSFSGAILFLIVFSVVRFGRSRLSRRWQYYIWLLVVLRFLVPFTFTHTLTGYLFRGAEMMAEQSAQTERKENDRQNPTAEPNDGESQSASDYGTEDGESGETKPAGMTESGGTTSAGDMTDNGGKQDRAADSLTESTGQESAAKETSVSGGRPGPSFWLAAIWAIGAFGLLVHKITVYRSYMRFLKAGNKEVSELATLNLLAEEAERLGIRRTIELYRNPAVTSPVMAGAFRPRIVIPDRAITEKELICIFAHELVHLKYCDLFYKWLVQITICIHWFNPFVWLLGKEVNKRCELACDEKVIGALDNTARKDYGDTLLSFLERGGTYPNPTAAITLTEGAEQLIERLGAIMDYRKKSKLVIILTTALTVALCFFFSGIGAYAGQRDVEKETTGTEREGRETETTGTEREERKAETAWEDDEYSILYDEDANTYYILVDGAAIEDRPSGVASGWEAFAIVLVRKSGYAAFTFGYPFMKPQFLEELESQCMEAVDNGWISEAEAELVRKAAVSIAVDEGILEEEDYLYTDDIKIREIAEEERENLSQEDAEHTERRYSYYQRAQYEEPYLIEFGWNLAEEDAQFYAHTELLLKDRSRMTVYFAKEAEEWMEDAAAMEAAAGLLEEMKQTARSRFGMEMERPFIVRMIELPPDEIEEFARRAFESKNIADFSAVLEQLPEEEKKEYCEKSYENDAIDFFSILIAVVDVDYVKDFVEKSYDRNEMDYFVLSAGCLPEAARKALMKRALQENREDFYYMLKNMAGKE